MVDARPKAKQWIDKSFYIGLKLGEVELNETTLTNQCQVIHGDTIFKQSTNVVSNRYELDLYMDAIAKIIESERIWSDPDMADFDIGERDSGSLKLAKRMRQKKINTAVVDPINDCNEEAKEEGPTDNLDLEASDDEDSEKENKEPIHGGENCVRMTRARLRTTVE